MENATDKQTAFLSKIIDSLLILALWNLAFFIRFKFLVGFESITQSEFFNYSIMPIALTLYFNTKNRLYQKLTPGCNKLVLWQSIKSNFEAGITLTLILYFTEPIRLSRILLGTYILSTLVIVPLVKIIKKQIMAHFRKKGLFNTNCIVIGNGNQLNQYLKKLSIFKHSGIEIMKRIDKLDDIASFIQSRAPLKYDTVIIGFKSENYELLEKVLSKIYNENVSIIIIPEIHNTIIGAKISLIENITMITINEAPISGSSWFFKRIFDIVSSSIGLVLIFPVLVCISIIIKLTSKGPIFYSQERMGLDGKIFKMWKFRTMECAKKNEDIFAWSSKNNSRITTIGALLRQTSLDELPQLWNVFKGEMSLVGPRPERPYFVSKFKDEIPDYMLRHKMKAGITGLAQINGLRGDTCIKSRIEQDIHYIKTWSILLDLKIILLTFIKGFLNKNAY